MINPSSDQLKKWIYGLVIILLVALLVAGLFFFLSFLTPFFKTMMKVIIPFLIAGFIIYLVHPFVEFMEKKNIPRPLSILFIFAIILSMFVTIILKGTPYLIREGEALLEQLPDITKTYREILQTMYQEISYFPKAVQDQIDEWVHRGEAWVGTALEEIGSALMTLLDWTLLLFVIPFIVFYGLKDIPLLQRSVWYITPKRMRKTGKEVIKELDHTLGSYIRGQIIVGIFVGVLSLVGFWIIDMPYGGLLAIFIGLTNIIPYFGPILGSVPVLLLSLTESIELMILGLVIVFAVQILEANVLAPVIVGKSIHAHPLLIIFALILGSELAGFVGLILAVPIFAVLKVLALHWRQIIRERRGIYD
ncbi:AI-2E family transporter [Salipaludibacillus daqingensis]|uniref:AI-2E family transporter n=1 Tax=Salipaludibacillus daqingensis TaxID=3041001 RepID=UPI0024732C59|nr:AI-2E family transporter [Salipaludibacillus daqingensis]